MELKTLVVNFPKDPPIWLECPVCGQDTNSLKEYRVVESFFFAFFYLAWQSIDCVACPDCMRRYMVKRLAINFFSANFAWPVVLLPPFLILFARSFTLGHSKKIQDEFRDGYQKVVLRAKWAEEDAGVSTDQA